MKKILIFIGVSLLAGLSQAEIPNRILLLCKAIPRASISSIVVYQDLTLPTNAPVMVVVDHEELGEVLSSVVYSQWVSRNLTLPPLRDVIYKLMLVDSKWSLVDPEHPNPMESRIEADCSEQNDPQT